jgi:hypothetical protein
MRVSTPKPSAFSADVVFSTASSNDVFIIACNPISVAMDVPSGRRF